MASNPELVSNHWNYFISLDEDLLCLSRYLEIAKDNYKSYSIELARILLAAASEIDVICKMFCIKCNAQSKADNIDQYRNEILKSDPLVAETCVHIPRFGLSIKPWAEWVNGRNPSWWKAYNFVKHHRNSHFSDANLENSLNAVAGLFVLLLFYYKEEGQKGLLSPDPTLLRAGAPFSIGRNLYEPYTEIYTLKH